MKNLFTTLSIAAVFFFAVAAHGQTYQYDDSWSEQGFTLKEARTNQTDLQYSVEEFSLQDIDIKGEAMKKVALPGHFLPNDEGAPDLPGKGRYIAVPNHADVELVITNMRKETIENVSVAPAPRIPKDDEPGPLQYSKDEKIYQKNAFYPQNPVSISHKEKIRGVDVVMLGITPFQYNPVTKELVVLRDIEVELQYTGGTGEFGRDKYRSRWFDPLLQDAVLNHTVIPNFDYHQQNTLRDGTGCEYLIVSPDGEAFQAWADSIKRFRNMQGIHTEVVTLSEIGANDPDVLEDYFDDAYNNWDTPPAAVLLLGDYGTSMENSVVSPIYDSYCVSDNIYADVTGNHMPDIVFARITANNEEQLETMVSKMINYEKNPPTSFDFYNNPITALGWQHERWFQICSESIFGFWQNNLGKEPRRENVLYSGSTSSWSSATNTGTVIDYFGESGTGYIEDTPDYMLPLEGSGDGVNEGINSGAFMLQHRDHGFEEGWGEPDYTNDDIDDLYNTDLTFIMSINCLTGKYNISGESFTEKFHRYTNEDDELSGALGLIAASEVSYSFVNDTYVWGAYDNMWPDFLPDYGSTPEPRGIKPAFGNAAGKYYLEQSSWPYNTNNKEVTYHLFHHHGGAFMTVYSEQPQDLDVAHNEVLLSGPDFFTVTADEGALIALSVDGEILGTAEGTGAPVDIPIEPQMPGTMVDVVVTKQNYFRYHQQITVIPPDGPYVIKNSYEINDEEGNNNSIAEYGEALSLSLTVENVGNEDAEDVTVTIESDDPYITITDDTEEYGTIPAESMMTMEDAFEVQVHDSIPDNHTVSFNVIAQGSESWESSFSMKLYAPVLSIGNLQVIDTEGNDNGRLDPGETADILIDIENSGHCPAPEVVSEMFTESSTLTLNSAEDIIEVVDADTVLKAAFNVTVDAGAPIGSFVTLENMIESAPYADEKAFTLKVGLIIEDWESGSLETFNWETSGNEEWYITEEPVFEGDYALASGEISDNQESLLEISYEVMFDDTISFYRKVSSEGGYDYLRFYIDGEEKGSWAGELGWQKVSYPVTAGEHTFTWKYIKDGYVSSGEDRAWVDFIVLPQELATTAYAGPDIHGCEAQSVQVTGATATHYNSISWETSGTGTFNSVAALHPEYTPSEEDVENGEVMLTMTAHGIGDDDVADEVTAYFHDQPQLTGITNMEICAGDSVMFAGVEAESYAALAWQTAGDGTFTDSEAENPVYHPGEADVAAESAMLSLTLEPLGTCEPLTLESEVVVNPLPALEITAGTFEACEESMFEIEGTVTGSSPWSITTNEDTMEVADSEMTIEKHITSDTMIVFENVVDNNGCAAAIDDTIQIMMNPLPESAAMPAGVDTVDLVFNASSEYSAEEVAFAAAYEWELHPAEAGTLTAEEMQATVEWSDSFTGQAEITVSGINECGEGIHSEPLVVDVKNTVGLSEHALAKYIRIYPNPSEGLFTISKTDVFEGDVRVRVTNTLSEVVYTDRLNLKDGNYELDLSQMQSGVYLLMIETQNKKRIVKRLIIQ
ncbi:MAG: C25 family cysteine peptidase [Bacteroidota bacterium]